jgi:hypothetical protein
MDWIEAGCTGVCHIEPISRKALKELRSVPNVVNGKTDSLFLGLLAMFDEQDQNVSTKTGANYAPAKMALHPKANGFNKRQLAASMQRLLDTKRIKVVIEGSPSRQRERIAINQPATLH